MIETYLLSAVFGTLVGYILGLLPGLGAVGGLVILSGFLLKQDVMTLVIFYSCLINAAQYSGSLSALFLGVPGENTSIPIIRLRKHFIKSQNFMKVIVLTALGSFIAALSSLAISLLAIDWISSIDFYLRSWVILTVGISGLGLSIIFSSNRWWQSILLITTGWILSKIGFESWNNVEFLTLNNDYLRGGIPNITVLLGLFALPNILNCFAQLKKTKYQIIQQPKLKDIMIKPYLPVMARAIPIGFFSGLIPYIGVTISSNIAYYFEKWFRRRDYISQAVAAESANNASTISVLIPLLIFGIAIQASEGVLLDIITQNGQSLSWKNIDFTSLTAMLVLSNMLAMSLSWPLAGKILNFYQKNMKYIMWTVIGCCIYTVLNMGSKVAQSEYYLICLIIFSLVGWLLRKKDTLPLIFAFLLQESLEPTIIRLIIILLF
jgi:putative tricarboxylic transport membrane protein